MDMPRCGQCRRKPLATRLRHNRVFTAWREIYAQNSRHKRPSDALRERFAEGTDVECHAACGGRRAAEIGPLYVSNPCDGAWQDHQREGDVRRVRPVATSHSFYGMALLECRGERGVGKHREARGRPLYGEKPDKLRMERRDDGRLVACQEPLPDPKRFPNGLTPVSDYVHGKGMRFGIYTDAAEYTCAGAFGSFGKEQIDADAYARWKVDIVKCDYCNAPSERDTAFIRYRAMADALEKAGYGTMLYICEWGQREPWKWGAEAGGRCWRISQDVRDCWTGAGNG